ncbi:MAG: hypothetical protein IAG13_34580, partial [Deltaproteobacteria bacterium]|nr:hypothetical protein [Nannocystaceae bacterium]
MVVTPAITLALVGVVARAYVAPSPTDPRPADAELARRSDISRRQNTETYP